MNTANKILDEHYFITATVVDWVDIFTRPKYKHIVLDSLAYYQQRKGLRLYAWGLMSNHLHAIVSATGEQTVADIVRDFKKFTSKRILAELETDPQESRREWMLDRFRFAGANDRKITSYRFWQDGCHQEFICSQSAPQLSAKTYRKLSRHPTFPQKSIADSDRQSIFPEKSIENSVSSVLLQKVALPTQNNNKK
ncbi:MAG: transposase [Bacteroides sp.]|nr:transposase [Bacteroides sp.]